MRIVGRKPNRKSHEQPPSLTHSRPSHGHGFPKIGSVGHQPVPKVGRSESGVWFTAKRFPSSAVWALMCCLHNGRAREEGCLSYKEARRRAVRAEEKRRALT